VKDSPPRLDLEGGGGVDPFEVWYKQYPKHFDKKDARKAYCAVIKNKLATPEQLLAAATGYAAERTRQDRTYTPAAGINPATITIRANRGVDWPVRVIGDLIRIRSAIASRDE